MDEALDALKMALRVLTSLTERKRPAPSDVDALRRYSAELAAQPLDELACEVIQLALQSRAETRQHHAH